LIRLNGQQMRKRLDETLDFLEKYPEYTERLEDGGKIKREKHS